MPKSRARSAACRSFVAFLLVAFATGCVSVRAISPGGALGANEGLLVLQLQTDVALRSISIEGSPVRLDVAAGTHLLLLAVSAGRHRWSHLGITNFGNIGASVRFPDEDEFWFRVEPGHINYPGMLEVYSRGWFYVRSVDRSALALDEIRSRYPSLIERYPIVYSGLAPSVFLERYQAAKSASGHASEAGASRAR
jgi:hypothetical protein